MSGQSLVPPPPAAVQAAFLYGGTAPVAGRLAEGSASGGLRNSAIAETVTGAVLTFTAILTGNRQKTFRDGDGTVAELEAAQTWPAPQTISLASAAAGLVLNRQSSANHIDLQFNTAGVGRWTLRLVTAESGSNVGGDFQILRRDDAGALLGTAMGINRATGLVTLSAVSTGFGSVSDLAIRVGDSGLGFYRVSANVMGLATSGIQGFQFQGGNDANLTVYGRGTNGVSSGAVTVVRSASDGTNGQVTANTRLLVLRPQGTDDTGAVNSAGGLECCAAQAWTATARGSYWQIAGIANGTTALVVRQRWYDDGGVQIGGTYGTSPGTGQLLAQGIAGGVQTVSTTGAIAALDSTTAFIRCTGAAVDLQGLLAPAAGARMVKVWFQNAATIRHENAGASAANRITSDTGADIAVGAGRTVILIYDPTSARWRPCRWS